MTSRSAGTPRIAAACSHDRRRSAYSPSTSACGALRVDHQQGQPGRRRVERHGLDGERAGVEEHQVPGPAVQRGHLVHDPGRGPDHVVLRPPGGRRQLVEREPQPAEVVPRDGHRALQRRRRRQARAHGDVAVDDHVQPRHVVAGLPQRPGDSRDVAGPARGDAGGDGGQRHLDRRAQLRRAHPQHGPVGDAGRPRPRPAPAPAAARTRRCSRCARRSGSPGPAPTTVPPACLRRPRRTRWRRARPDALIPAAPRRRAPCAGRRRARRPRPRRRRRT